MSLLPPIYLSCVVSIEVETKNAQGQAEMRPIATGFLLGRYAGIQNAEGQKQYRVFMVTNRHVVEDKAGKRLKEVDLRFNLTDKSQPAKHFKYPLLDAQGHPTWLRHSNAAVDIAVLPIAAQGLVAEKIEYYFLQDDTDVFLAKDFAQHGISTGDGVFVLGFPLGLRGTDRNYAIVRQGHHRSSR